MRSRQAFAILILFFLAHIQCATQKDLRVDALNRITYRKNDTVWQFYTIQPAEVKIKKDARQYYSWYKPDTILITYDGFGGKLLHGSFTVFYPNQNLKEQGNFMKGLKTGEWKTWFPDGHPETIMHWREGKKDGPFEVFNASGQISRKGSFVQGELNGYVQEFQKDSVINQVLYHKGIAVIPPKKDSTQQPAPHHVPKP